MERLNEEQNEAREKLKLEITTADSGLEKKIEMLDQRIGKEVLEITGKVTALSEPANGQNISFTVRMQNRKFGSNSIFIFDDVVNNDGSGYNPTTGKFTAPVVGKYLFSTTITLYSNNWVQVYLMKNDVNIGRVRADKDRYNDYDAASVTAVVNLNQGDLVWVKFIDGNSGNVYPDCFTSFSGILIQS